MFSDEMLLDNDLDLDAPWLDDLERKRSRLDVGLLLLRLEVRFLPSSLGVAGGGIASSSGVAGVSYFSLGIFLGFTNHQWFQIFVFDIDDGLVLAIGVG